MLDKKLQHWGTKTSKSKSSLFVLKFCENAQYIRILFILLQNPCSIQMIMSGSDIVLKSWKQKKVNSFSYTYKMLMSKLCTQRTTNWGTLFAKKIKSTSSSEYAPYLFWNPEIKAWWFRSLISSSWPLLKVTINIETYK